MPAAHSKIGASSMERWAACPGSVVLSEGIESRSSVYAVEGTAAHALAEDTLLNKGPGGDVSAWIGQHFWFDDHGEKKSVLVDEEMADAVQTYVNHIQKLVVDAAGNALGEPGDGPTSVSHIEHRFDLSHLHPGLFGTSDYVLWEPRAKTLHVVDYKHGAGKPVHVKGNPQLRYYAVGALMTLNYPAEYVEITIVQPRCSHPDGPIRTERLSVLDLLDWSADLVAAAKRVEEAREQYQYPDVPREDWQGSWLAAGEHCRWCPAASVPDRCPLLKSKAQELAKQVFAPGLPYDPAVLAETLEWLPILEAWIKNTREFAYAEAEQGRAIPGHKLVEKRATRKWRDPAEVEAQLADFLEPAQLYSEPELRTPAEIEKLIGKGGKDIVDGLCTKQSSGHTLVPESDKRPAVKVDAKSAFSAAE